ncbi:hypothetical protein LX92_04323 [Maribacter polysiphoniae]|uniref:Uncharacterized protein n=1 Tax=Maribacter polysiphoniae TaxID=429344 RepID=A0A316DMH8_9FLAO|nr:hypothetical protein LX92_04323 [Maribacter polysiphoniae]
MQILKWGLGAFLFYLGYGAFITMLKHFRLYAKQDTFSEENHLSTAIISLFSFLILGCIGLWLLGVY